MNDTDRLNWLEAQTEIGHCPGLINDDNGHWAVSFEGSQNCPQGDEPCDIATNFFVEADNWYSSIREAIDAAMGEGVDNKEYNYAKELASAIWREKYKDESPDWEPLPDLMGVLSQIDNMIAGMIGTEYDNERIPRLEAEIEKLEKDYDKLKCYLLSMRKEVE